MPRPPSLTGRLKKLPPQHPPLVVDPPLKSKNVNSLPKMYKTLFIIFVDQGGISFRELLQNTD